MNIPAITGAQPNPSQAAGAAGASGNAAAAGAADGSGATFGTAADKTGMAQTVDYKSFLQLLVAQMKNQDPTSPMESTDYVAQLATFSQVEQSVQMNNRLDQILQASTFAQAGDLIGREIESPDGEMKGIVKSVRLYSDGIMATLEDGSEMPVWAGVIIR